MTGRLRLSGGEIELAWHGERRPGARVLVFLHEGLGSAGLWRDFPARVAVASGLPALVYSRFGYGASDPCALPRPLGYMHDEGLQVLPELLERLEIDAYVLVGHSDGASIAIIHAGGAPRPGLAGAVLMAPHVFNEDISVRSITAAKAAYEGGDLRSRLERWHGANVDCAFYGWNGAWLDPGFRDWNIEAYLPAIDVPLLVIQGRDDEYGTLAQVEAIRAGATRAGTERLILDHCGHSPHRDRPEETLASIAHFLGRISG
ncbi:MAG: alpha/beta hydrolase [Alphaproteobacteria bacterium]|nr:alpha/beta hydrolase [Alphaproteobacteria bacterium]